MAEHLTKKVYCPFCSRMHMFNPDRRKNINCECGGVGRGYENFIPSKGKVYWTKTEYITTDAQDIDERVETPENCHLDCHHCCQCVGNPFFLLF